MELGVYAPLVLPLLAVPLVRWLSGRLHPTWASWLVAGSALVLGAGAAVALALLAFAALATLSAFARLGHWSTAQVWHMHVVDRPVDVLACALLSVLTAATVVAVVRRARALLAAHRMARQGAEGSELMVVEDDRPIAHALPGRPGRIVVSTRMLATLTPSERRALLAHERAHLDGAHHLFVAAVDVAAAGNPLLRPLMGPIRYTTERWADETAAGQVGDRTTVARAVGKAALAGRSRPTPDLVTMGATAGPVPRRVAALLATPPGHRLRVVLASPVGAFALVALGLTVGSAVFAVDAASDLHHILEIAQHPLVQHG